MATALLVVDMLNTYDHEDAEPLVESARGIIDPLREAIEEAREQDLFVVYINDNHGDWGAGANKLADAALNGAHPELVEPIRPWRGAPFVVKARHSIFYETQLEYMLHSQDIDRIILTGQVTEQCIFYSAIDGYVRHFDLTLARDCVAHIDERLAAAALEMMEGNMHAHVTRAADALARAAA
jgi:nicotinamidase-related amidase